MRTFELPVQVICGTPADELHPIKLYEIRDAEGEYLGGHLCEKRAKEIKVALNAYEGLLAACKEVVGDSETRSGRIGSVAVDMCVDAIASAEAK